MPAVICIWHLLSLLLLQMLRIFLGVTSTDGHFKKWVRYNGSGVLRLVTSVHDKMRACFRFALILAGRLVLCRLIPLFTDILPRFTTACPRKSSPSF